MDDPRDNKPGTIYLLHFDRALGDPERPRAGARHYLGWANGEGVESRVERHRGGTGAKIVRALVEQGGDFEVVWTRPGTRNDERRLKRTGHFADRLCPVCRQESPQ